MDPQGEQQSEPPGRHWLVSHELAGLGPASCPLCPKDAQHGWQLSGSQGHLLEGAALMLCRLTISPACPCPPPPHSPGAPQGAGNRCFLSDGVLS